MSIIQNLTQNRPAVQVDGRIVNQNAAKSQDSLRSVDTGDKLSGKIISMTDENGVRNAQIRLGDNSVINARLQDGMYLKEGQTISFEVRGTSGQITLSPLYENTSIDPTALKALTAAGLEVNQDTVSMVKTMMENGMGIDKNSLNAMHQLVNSHPDAEVSSLVQMKALDIPVNEQNIQQFESYKNYEHQVVETMKSIMDDLPEAYNSLVQNGEGKAANDLYGGILDMLAKGAEHMEETALRNEAQGPSGNTGVLEQQAAPDANAIIDGKTAATDASLIKEGAVLSDNPLAGAQGQEGVLEAENGTADVKGEAEIQNGEKSVINGENSETAKADGNIKQDILVMTSEAGEANASKEAGGGPNVSDLQRSLEDIGAGKAGEKAVVTGDQTGASKVVFGNDFAKLIQDLNISTGAGGNEIQKLIAQAHSGKPAEIDKMALLKELADAYSSTANTSDSADKAFTKIFGNNEYNKLMKSIMQDEWMIRPSDVSVKENVENLYARLNSQAKQLTQQLTDILGADSKVAQTAANLQNNIDFMNQVNQMFHYVQLPLKMADQDAHGDLYVYSNGKRKFEPGDTVSAILHLDMDNLGPLDVYVKMKDTNVKTNFYVADESVIDLISEHIGELNDRLNKRGYTMEARMMLHTDMDDESEDPPVKSLLDSKKTAFLSVTSFDARA